MSEATGSRLEQHWQKLIEEESRIEEALRSLSQLRTEFLVDLGRQTRAASEEMASAAHALLETELDASQRSLVLRIQASATALFSSLDGIGPREPSTETAPQALPGEAPDTEEPVEPLAEPPQAGPAAAELDAPAIARLKQTLGKATRSMLPRLIDGYCRESQRLLAEIGAAAAESDTKTVHRATETLRVTSETFGASTLAEMARQIGDLARQEKLEDASFLIGRLDSEIQSTMAALFALKQELTA